MVKMSRWWALGAALIVCGCNGIAGIHEGILDPCDSDAGCGSGGYGGEGGSSSATASASAGSGSAPLNCPGSSVLGDPILRHCYWLNPKKSSFNDANDACAMFGGATLAAITTPDELALVSPLLTEDVWIGGKETGLMGSYTWVDKEPWGFAPWRPGEPNGFPLQHQCVKLAGPAPYGFADENCSGMHPFLCERGPAGTEHP